MNKSWKLVASLMTIILVSSSGLILAQEEAPVPKPDDEEKLIYLKHSRTHFHESLGLNVEQTKMLEEERLAFQKERITQSSDLRIARLDFANLLKGKGNDAEVLKKQEEMNVLLTEFALKRTQHLLKVKSILTDEQWEKFNKFSKGSKGRKFGRSERFDRSGKRKMDRHPREHRRFRER